MHRQYDSLSLFATAREGIPNRSPGRILFNSSISCSSGPGVFIVCIPFICYYVCSFHLSHLFYTVQQEMCFVSIVLEMFLLSLIRGQKACPHWLRMQGAFPSLGSGGGGVWLACLCVWLWPCPLEVAPGHFLWGPALFCMAGYLNLSFPFASDISGEVVTKNVILQVTFLVRYTLGGKRTPSGLTSASNCFALNPGSPREEEPHIVATKMLRDQLTAFS